MPFVLYDLPTDTYLMPRQGYWQRKDLAAANGGDETKWTTDLQRARSFTTYGAAANAYSGKRPNVVVLETKMVLVANPWAAPAP